MALRRAPPYNQYLRDLADAGTEAFQMIVRALKIALTLDRYRNCRKERNIIDLTNRVFGNKTIRSVTVSRLLCR